MRVPQNPPSMWPILTSLLQDRPELALKGSATTPDGRYLQPPEGLAFQEWWATTKSARTQRLTPIQAMKSLYPLDFGFVQLPTIQAELHDFDRKNVGRELLTALGNHDLLAEYRVRQLIEEAINSSVLEGARPTTRELARQLVRE